MERSEPVVIAGGGAGGLSVAAMLDAKGIPSVVLERDEVAASWAGRYESLRLNTPRFTSTLARYRMPRRYGRWPGKDQVAEYLRDYARRLQLNVRTGTEVRLVDRDGDRWRVETSDGDLRTPCVVIALGHDREPFIPDWPGRDEFSGEVVHAATYTEPSPYRGKDVLIVSAANTGTEIAYELSRNGVGRVRNAMRSVPPVFPREWLGWPLNYTATFLDLFPDQVGDGITRATQRVIYGDLSPHGIPRPTYGVQTMARRRHRSPLIDAGYVEALKAGQVEVVPTVVSFDGADVLLADGGRIQPEVVIVATGYRTGLEPIVGHLGVLDDRAYPQVPRGSDSPKAPGLFFNGYWATMSGQLRHMRRDSRKIARAIARRLNEG